MLLSLVAVICIYLLKGRAPGEQVAPLQVPLSPPPAAMDLTHFPNTAGCFHFALCVVSCESGGDANTFYEKIAARGLMGVKDNECVSGAVLASYGGTWHPDRPNADATNNNNRSLL